MPSDFSQHTEGSNIFKRTPMIETMVTFISMSWWLLSVNLHDVKNTKAILEIASGAYCLFPKLEIIFSGLLLSIQCLNIYIQYIIYTEGLDEINLSVYRTEFLWLECWDAYPGPIVGPVNQYSDTCRKSEHQSYKRRVISPCCPKHLPENLGKIRYCCLNARDDVLLNPQQTIVLKSIPLLGITNSNIYRFLRRGRNTENKPGISQTLP